MDEFINYGLGASYDAPLPLPTTDPDEWPTKCIEINDQWVAYVLGAVRVLKMPEFWDWGTEQEKALATARAEMLIDRIADPQDCASSSLCITLTNIMAAAEGNLALFVAGLLAATIESCGEFLKERLEAILGLDAIMDFFFGSSADYAEFASVLPTYGVEIVPIAFRQNGCDFQMSIDNGETWVTQFAFDLESCPALQGAPGVDGVDGATGATGATGAQGLQGMRGEKGDPGSGVTFTPAEPSNLPKYCSGAGALVDWCNQLVEVMLSGIDAETAVLAQISSILAASVVGDLVADDVLAAIAAAQAVTTSIIRASHSPTVDAELKCEVYCFLKGYPTVDEAAMLALDAYDHALGNAWKVAFWQLFGASRGGEFAAAFMSGATNEDNSCETDCTECPGAWCYAFDFTASDGGFTKGDQYGQWVSGTGWCSTQRGDGQAELGTFNRSFTASEITYIEVTIDKTVLDAYANMYLYAYNGATLVASMLTDADGLTGVHAYRLNVGATADTVGFNLDTTTASGNHLNGSAFKLTGPGTNPFGPDNCTP